MTVVRALALAAVAAVGLAAVAVAAPATQAAAATPTAAATATTATAAAPRAVTAPATVPGSSPGYFVRDAGRLGDTRATGFTQNGAKVRGPVSGLVSTDALASTPTTATAVLLEATALAPSTSGYIQVGAGGGALTTAINFSRGASQTVLISTPIATDRSIDLSVSGTSGLVVDEVGYDDPDTSTGSAFTALAPTRAVDTRSGIGPQHALFTVTLPSSVPTGSTAVLNVTATTPTANGYLQLGAHGGTLTTAVNYVSGVSQTGLAYVNTDSAGEIDIAPSGSTQVVVDVVGYLTAAASGPGAFVSIPAVRVADSRNGTGVATGPRSGATDVTVPLSAVPSTASGVVVDVTPISPSASSYVRLGATGSSTTTTILNVAKGQSLTSLSITKLSSTHQLTVDLAGFSAQLVVDVVGYFTGPPDTTPPGPVTAVRAAGTVAFSGVAGETLSWTNPSATDDYDTVVRRATGSSAPTSISDGTAVGTADAPASTVTDTGLTGGATYSYALFAQDDSGNTAPAATITVVAPTPGNDVSDNNCGASYPATALFGIINPTQGFAFSDPNECLSAQDSWASATGGEQWYLPLADKGTASSHWPLGATSPKACPSTGDSTTPGCAYDYGYDQAENAYGTASATDHEAKTWWLDIEDNGQGNWSNATGAQSQSQNTLVVQGAIAYLAGEKVSVGLYSTASFFTQLIGSGTAFKGYAEWYATEGASDPQSSCSMPFVSGARVKLVQEIPTSGNGLDADYLC